MSTAEATATTLAEATKTPKVSHERYRNALKNAREEFLVSPQLNTMDLPEWLEFKYGFAMIKNPDGYYTMDYNIVDDKLFLMFQIKFFSE